MNAVASRRAIVGFLGMLTAAPQQTGRAVAAQFAEKLSDALDQRPNGPAGDSDSCGEEPDLFDLLDQAQRLLFEQKEQERADLDKELSRRRNGRRRCYSMSAAAREAYDSLDYDRRSEQRDAFEELQDQWYLRYKPDSWRAKRYKARLEGRRSIEGPSAMVKASARRGR